MVNINADAVIKFFTDLGIKIPDDKKAEFLSNFAQLFGAEDDPESGSDKVTFQNSFKQASGDDGLLELDELKHQAEKMANKYTTQAEKDMLAPMVNLFKQLPNMMSNANHISIDENLFKKIAGEDGKISQAEMMALDTDGDGSVSQAEMDAFKAKGTETKPAEDTLANLQAIAKEFGGQGLSKDEIQEMIDSNDPKYAMFKAIFSDHGKVSDVIFNKILSENSSENGNKPTTITPEMLAVLDTNGDGKITAQEIQQKFRPGGALPSEPQPAPIDPEALVKEIEAAQNDSEVQSLLKQLSHAGLKFKLLDAETANTPKVQALLESFSAVSQQLHDAVNKLGECKTSEEINGILAQIKAMSGAVANIVAKTDELLDPTAAEDVKSVTPEELQKAVENAKKDPSLNGVWAKIDEFNKISNEIEPGKINPQIIANGQSNSVIIQEFYEYLNIAKTPAEVDKIMKKIKEAISGLDDSIKLMKEAQKPNITPPTTPDVPPTPPVAPPTTPDVPPTPPVAPPGPTPAEKIATAITNAKNDAAIKNIDADITKYNEALAKLPTSMQNSAEVKAAAANVQKYQDLAAKLSGAKSEAEVTEILAQMKTMAGAIAQAVQAVKDAQQTALVDEYNMNKDNVIARSAWADQYNNHTELTSGSYGTKDQTRNEGYAWFRNQAKTILTNITANIIKELNETVGAGNYDANQVRQMAEAAMTKTIDSYIKNEKTSGDDNDKYDAAVGKDYLVFDRKTNTKGRFGFDVTMLINSFMTNYTNSVKDTPTKQLADIKASAEKRYNDSNEASSKVKFFGPSSLFNMLDDAEKTKANEATEKLEAKQKEAKELMDKLRSSTNVADAKDHQSKLDGLLREISALTTTLERLQGIAQNRFSNQHGGGMTPNFREPMQHER